MTALGGTIYSTEYISQALEREMELARLEKRMRYPAVAHRSHEVSNEERLGAALLRMLIDRMDVFLIDTDVTVFRLVIPNQLAVDLDTWESATAELEADYDFEMEQYLEKTA